MQHGTFCDSQPVLASFPELAARSGAIKAVMPGWSDLIVLTPRQMQTCTIPGSDAWVLAMQ